MENEKREIEQFAADVIMGRPYGFSVGGKHFYLYPMTLGKMLMTHNILESLSINQKNVEANVTLEALRLAKEKKEECLTYICMNTCKDKEELFDTVFVSKRTECFRKELSVEDIAALMIILLSSDRTSVFMHHYGIDKEHDRLSTVMRVKEKENKNTLTFGGKSLFGSFIDVACERYGWTKQYVVWEIDYTSLRMMLADKINSVYLSDDEMKKLPADVRSANEEVIKPTKENMELIKNMDWR